MTAVSADVTKLPKRESTTTDALPLDDNINQLLEHFYDDDTIKALDFPMEDIDATDEDWKTQLQGLEPYYESSFHYLSTSYEGTSGVTAITTSGRSCLQNNDFFDQKHMHLIPTHSPVSVLKSQSESQSSGSAQHLRPLEPNFMNIRAPEPRFVNPVKKKRTQCRRARPANFSHRFTFPCASSNSSVSDNFYHFETFLTEEMLNPEKRRQKKKNPSFHETGEISETKRCVEPGKNRETKRCTHCAVTKTPQWREGPLGPKTLCNACGVRYRSGHLFPEYRPAASPTFVPAVHSNSHKKVIELRNKGCQAS
ncbi:hypothetical protein ACLB2K_026715 [Fragaria x ananassa]